jgi:hypothetical protein
LALISYKDFYGAGGQQARIELPKDNAIIELYKPSFTLNKCYDMSFVSVYIGDRKITLISNEDSLIKHYLCGVLQSKPLSYKLYIDDTAVIPPHGPAPTDRSCWPSFFSGVIIFPCLLLYLLVIIWFIPFKCCWCCCGGKGKGKVHTYLVEQRAGSEQYFSRPINIDSIMATKEKAPLIVLAKDEV